MPFLTWVKTAKPSASYATETYNSVNAFYLVDASGKKQAVRWSMKPLAQDTAGATAPEGAIFWRKTWCNDWPPHRCVFS